MAIPTDTQRAQTRISQIQAAKEPAGGKRKKKKDYKPMETRSHGASWPALDYRLGLG